MSERVLVVNADDFGLSPGVNAGVVRAHEQGILTSASLMVRFPAAAEAADYARGAPDLSLGLHVDLGEWAYKDEGEWETLYEVVSLEDPAAVVDEVGRQVEAFRRLTGRDPSHLDSHQHVHSWDPVVTTFRTLAHGARRPAAPLHRGRQLLRRPVRAVDGRHADPGRDHRAGLIDIIKGLPAGVTELACHPGLGDDSGSTYDRERTQEVEILCDPRVREAIEREGVALRSFSDIAPQDAPGS